MCQHSPQELTLWWETMPRREADRQTGKGVAGAGAREAESPRPGQEEGTAGPGIQGCLGRQGCGTVQGSVWACLKLFVAHTLWPRTGCQAPLAAVGCRQHPATPRAQAAPPRLPVLPAQAQDRARGHRRSAPSETSEKQTRQPSDRWLLPACGTWRRSNLDLNTPHHHSFYTPQRPSPTWS